MKLAILALILSNVLWFAAYCRLSVENANNNAAAAELEHKYNEVPNN